MLRVVPGSSNEVISIHSPTLGRLDIVDEQVIAFAEPIAGFDGCLRYALLPYRQSGRQDEAMAWLQALDPPFHTFLVTDPWSAVPEYQPDISDVEALRIGAPGFADTSILTILTVARPAGELTVNLQAPLLINTRDRVAKQVLLLNSETYGPRHRVCELP